MIRISVRDIVADLPPALLKKKMEELNQPKTFSDLRSLWDYVKDCNHWTLNYHYQSAVMDESYVSEVREIRLYADKITFVFAIMREAKYINVTKDIMHYFKFKKDKFFY